MNNENLTCANCGKCCANFLMLSKKEVSQIKEYIKLHNIQPTNFNMVLDQEQQNICPFRDIDNKRCKIYEVRPSICQTFYCSENSNFMNYDGVKLINLLETFFPNEYTNKKPNLSAQNKHIADLQKKLNLKTWDET